MLSNEPTIFFVDTCYQPKGVGLVITGTLRGKSISVDDNLYLGPINKKFVKIKVRSMHDNNQTSINTLHNTKRGCLGIRTVEKSYNVVRSDIKKGILAFSDINLAKNICYKFKAKVTILHHSTSIRNNYCSVIHCENIRQTVKIILPDDIKLKTNSEAEVIFEFIKKPEYIRPGTTFVFREGTTRGKGIILETYNI